MNFTVLSVGRGRRQVPTRAKVQLWATNVAGRATSVDCVRNAETQSALSEAVPPSKKDGTYPSIDEGHARPVSGLEGNFASESSRESGKWAWRDDDGWKSYTPEQIHLLETAFMEETLTEVDIDGIRKVDMSDRHHLKQRVIEHPDRWRSVRRHLTRVPIKLNETGCPGDGVRARPHVFVVAAKQAGKSYERQLLKNYRGTSPNLDDASSGMDVWQAGRATSAAPGYFQPFQIGHSVFVDGGIKVINHNP